MSDSIAITLSKDEGLVLFEFFARFCGDDDELTIRHNAEFLALMKISAQLDTMFVEPFDPRYAELLRMARERVAAGYEGNAPGVRGNEKVDLFACCRARDTTLSG